MTESVRTDRHGSGGAQSAYVEHNLTTPITGDGTGPLAGLTAVVKDAFDLAGERTGVGSPEWLAAAAPAAVTATAVRQLVDAGASVTGKTACDELLYSVTGTNAHYGTPTNPRAPDRIPGGSSSGSASATAAGACDLALGTDTGGSVRVPAALCGVFGIRTSHGRVSRNGVMAMAPSFDSVGWFAPSAGLLRLAATVLLSDVNTVAPVDRVVIASDLMTAADPGVRERVAAFLARVSPGMAPEVVLAGSAMTGWVDCFRTIQGFETWRSFGSWVRAENPALGPGIADRMRYASTVTAARAATARRQRAEIIAVLDGLLVQGTVAIMPTVPCPAPRLEAGDDELNEFRARTMAFTCVAGLTGRPQVSLPLGMVDGAPSAVSLLGWHGGDEALLDLAAELAAHLVA